MAEPYLIKIPQLSDTMTEGVADLPYQVPYLRVGVQHYDPGVPVGVWLHAFKSASHGQGAVCVGGSTTRNEALMNPMLTQDLRLP